METTQRIDTAILRQRRAVIRFIRKKLGNAVRRRGKVFYSSPHSLFTGRHILMGYNTGGDPSDRSGCTIEHNLKQWPLIPGNNYRSEKWADNGKRHNILQRRVQALFRNLHLNLDKAFTSNLFFFRSQEAASLADRDKKPSRPIWQKFLESSGAKNIICIGIKTATEFLRIMGAAEIEQIPIRTCHPRARAILLNATIERSQYKIVAIPHLSRFKVQDDRRLIRRIARHIKTSKSRP